MKHRARIAAMLAVAGLSLSHGGFAQTTPAAPQASSQQSGQVAGQELNAEGKSKEFTEARAKRNAQRFQNNASILTFLDRYGKQTGSVGERALYDGAVLSPDGKHIAISKEDLENESEDVWVLDAATGAVNRLTTSARTEFAFGSVWSPDSSRVAYFTNRKGQFAICARAANGQEPEEVLYSKVGNFVDIGDWSRDGKFLAFADSDLKGGTLYLLPVAGGPDRKPIEVFHSDLRIFGPRFSPDGRYLSYRLLDKTNKGEVFVRPADPASKDGPWQISDGSFSAGYWVQGGKALYYVARDRSVMAAEVSTTPTFSFQKPAVLFRQPVAVPDRLMNISADGEKFLVLPPARGHQLQQLTVFNREGQVVKKIGEPALYSQPAFSPDAKRLLVLKGDLKSGQQDFWVLDAETAAATRITNDTRFKTTPLWSPDGKYIYYTALIDGDWPIYRKPADGSGQEELLFRYTPGAFVGLDDISADGTFLVCESVGYIFLVSLSGNDPAARKPFDYIRDEFDDFTARLSPDGRFIMYRSDEAKPERFEVYIRPFDAAKPPTDDKQKWQVSKNGVFAMLHWRGDGKEVFFRGQELDSNDMVVMAVDVQTEPTFKAGTPKALFRVPGPITGSLGAVSRDGQRFVLAVNVSADKTTQTANAK